MAYYFMVEKKKGEYIPLDITNSKYFSRISNLKGKGATLQEIDIFTMMFSDLNELRESLLKEGILPYELYDKNLSTRILMKGKYNKVMYDFLYQKDIDYVMDSNKLIRRINDKLDSGDYRFVLECANNYLKYHECSSTAADVRAYANESIRIGGKSHYFDILDENGDNVLTRMTKLLVYNYNQYSSGKVEYDTTKIKYRNLHSLIAFVNNYDKKYNIVEEKNDKPKTRIKKQVEGQISIYELI